MPRHTRPTYTVLLPVFLLAFLLLSGCRKETQPAQATPDLPETGSGGYVSITVTADGGFGPSSSRTGVPGTRVPNPGEDGDGEQPGTGDENMVHDINVFFLTGNIPADGFSILDAKDAQVVASTYFSEDEISPSASGDITMYTAQREIDGLAIGGTYHALAIVNAGEDLGNKTVTDLQGLSFPEVINTVTEDGATRRKFLMASADDSGSFGIEPNNSPYNPTVVRISVERMAARVDCRWETEYIIDIDNGPSQQRDKVKVLGAALVNRYADDTYAFKRVSETSEKLESVIYLGDEMVENGVASNYVIDPGTASQNLRTYTVPFSIFSNDDWQSKITWKTPDQNITSTDPDTPSEEYGLLGYTTENVVTSDLATASRSQYCTGVVFKAQYLIDGKANDNGEYNVYWYEGRAYSSIADIGDGVPQDLDESKYADYGIVKYPDGICYYTYWIRHADDGDPDKISPMEYATVRNNIYQLNVSSISGIGGLTPEEGNIIIRVTLAEWRDDINIYPEF